MERGKINILAATLHKIKAINGTLQRDEEINKKEKTREEGNKQKIIEMKKRIWRNECTYSAQMPLNSLLRMLQNAHILWLFIHSSAVSLWKHCVAISSSISFQRRNFPISFSCCFAVFIVHSSPVAITHTTISWHVCVQRMPPPAILFYPYSYIHVRIENPYGFDAGAKFRQKKNAPHERTYKTKNISRTCFAFNRPRCCFFFQYGRRRRLFCFFFVAPPPDCFGPFIVPIPRHIFSSSIFSASLVSFTGAAFFAGPLLFSHVLLSSRRFI